jgi:hypothetical protein
MTQRAGLKDVSCNRLAKSGKPYTRLGVVNRSSLTKAGSPSTVKSLLESLEIEGTAQAVTRGTCHAPEFSASSEPW